MSNTFFQRVIFLAGLATIGGIAIALQPAQAEVPDFSNESILNSPNKVDRIIPETVSNFNQTETHKIKSASVDKTQPVPGTAETSASVLLNESGSGKGKGNRVAQYEIEPGRSTRSGSSYIGIGGNIGLTGSSGLGDNGFTLFAKIGLTRVLSVRPQVVIADDTDIIIPVTYDFAIQAEPFERLNFAPYIGAGVIFTTYRDSNVGLVLTGGIDVPITDRFTAVGSVSAAFVDTTSLGLTLGVAYNFGPGFNF